MPRFSLRPSARQDLADIWIYTRDKWGEAQADSYIHDLNNSFEILAEHPEKGRSCEEIRKGYRRHYVGKHTVFFRQGSDGIEIIRVLHQRMDPDRHFE